MQNIFLCRSLRGSQKAEMKVIEFAFVRWTWNGLVTVWESTEGPYMRRFDSYAVKFLPSSLCLAKTVGYELPVFVLLVTKI